MARPPLVSTGGAPASVVAPSRRRPLLWLPLALQLATVVLAEGGDADDEAVRRRLEEVVERRLSIEEVDHRAWDESGLLPEVEMGPLRLQEVFVLRHSAPFVATRVRVPPDYVSPMAGRRLASAGRRLEEADKSTAPVMPTLEDVRKKLSVDLTNPRVRVQSMAILNAMVMPEYVYKTGKDANSSAHTRLFPEEIYSQGNGVFKPPPDAEADSSAQTPTLQATQTKTQEEAAADRTEDMERLHSIAVEAMAANTVEALAAVNSKFLGKRSDPCIGLPETAAECGQDVGVSVSLYAGFQFSRERKVLVFHGHKGKFGQDQILWSHKLWLLEYFQQSLANMWGKAYMHPNAEMMKRRGGDAVAPQNVEIREAWKKKEHDMRCGFFFDNTPAAPDADDLGIKTIGNGRAIDEMGMFVVLRKLVREILPADRPKSEPDTYFTGSGIGGTYAALTSLWLQQEEGKAFVTYVIAGIGWNCMARRLFARDLAPHHSQEHIHFYAHMLDAYANAIDLPAGRVCYYGRRHLTPTIINYCSGIIGYSPGEVVWRGGTPTPDIEAARRAWDNCHYYTHSVWYAAMLFMDKDTLYIAGDTDGGCETVAPIPNNQAGNVVCPLATGTKTYCEMILDSSQPLPVEEMTAVATALLIVIVGSALCLRLCMENAKDKKWVFRMGVREDGKGWFEAVRDYLFGTGHASEDAAKRQEAARLRAREKREKDHKRRQAKAKDADADDTDKKKKKDDAGGGFGESFVMAADTGGTGGTGDSPEVIERVGHSSTSKSDTSDAGNKKGSSKKKKSKDKDKAKEAAREKSKESAAEDSPTDESPLMAKLRERLNLPVVDKGSGDAGGGTAEVGT